MKFVAVSCLHAPITSETYFNWLMRLLEEVKPDAFINLGDWYEGKAAKRWPSWSDENWDIEKEHLEVAKQANEINSRVSGLKVFMWGNHDDNQFGDVPDRIHKDVKSAVHYRNNVNVAPALKDWKVIEEYKHETTFRLGQLTFQHGAAANNSAEKDCAYLYGVPYGLYVCGHTHRPLEVTRAQERKVRLPYWYANPGCGANFDRMHYMDRLSKALWGRGAIVGEVSDSSVSNSKAFYGSPQWSAELRIESWAH
jgi:predicted phosphodiesterase